MAKLLFNLRFLSKAAIFFIIVFLIIDIVILWIVMKPQLPSFQLKAMVVTSLNNTTEVELTATFDVVVGVINPNIGLSISYEILEVMVWFGHCTIASASIAPFWQGAVEYDSVVYTQFGVVRKLFPHSVVIGITKQRARGSIDFGVTLLAQVRFWWSGIFRTRIRPLTVDCYPLHIVFSPNDNMNNNYTGRLVAPSECYQV